MPITEVLKDPEALTMTVIADFSATRERLWEAYTDPRQIEKFWGPVEWPATFIRHDVYPGGRSHYTMTGPDGEQSSGFWEFLHVDEGHSFEVRDGFADAEGHENTDMPSMRMTFQFEETEAGSRLVTTTHFGSADQLEQLLGMGMEEGMTSAMSQIDEVLADLSSFAAGRGTEAQILSDTQVRISRVIRGSVEDVWRAHHEPELLKRWLLGPDGWSMTVAVAGTTVGAKHRSEWVPNEGTEGEAFGFEGEVLEIHPPLRAVTTESMIGMPGEPNINELTLTPVEGATLLTLVITYPNAEVRDMILATGMTDGMETSYARLESEVLV
ncbi:SRPBCC family protein [Demequina sp. NBRC 110055]|uniref:SRPBCC family protein n=1 Tax=Demequina sp. NBRC 110055 TaxID=1570344 RepID=UPI000A021A21|nr:SRPBCC family protein [Demequina sp. NBRC 110055]